MLVMAKHGLGDARRPRPQLLCTDVRLHVHALSFAMPIQPGRYVMHISRDFPGGVHNKETRWVENGIEIGEEGAPTFSAQRLQGFGLPLHLLHLSTLTFRGG